MLSLLANRMAFMFSKMSRPKPKLIKHKEDKRSFAVSDQKAAKLSKSEQEQQNKIKMLEQKKVEEETIRQMGVYRSHHKSLEEFVSKQQLQNIRIQQHFYLKGQKQIKRKIPKQEPLDQKNAFYSMSNLTKNKKGGAGRVYRKIHYNNYAPVINNPLKKQLKQIDPSIDLRRVGSIGIKLGMTTSWDKWGNMVPTTVIELDRVQVVQIKQPVRGNKYYQVQMGSGEPNFKRMTKPLLGHFLKSQVPPKKHLTQFKVSKECLLPVGYMMTPRHYTPGMFVDVVSKSVGHGFQGTIKRFGFHRQPETHGNSLTTRVLGSTGCRQDPGRVFKGKKMYGRMGGKIAVQTGLTVFKIDVDKNLLFLKGSVPGKPGTIVKIRDTLNLDKVQKNLEYVHYPTFVQEEGVEYGRQISMYCGERDPAEIQVHDNAFMIEDDEEEAAATTTDKDAVDE